MSGNIYGIGTAAEYFYGKTLNELELHEAAMLAGFHKVQTAIIHSIILNVPKNVVIWFWDSCINIRK